MRKIVLVALPVGFALAGCVSNDQASPTTYSAGAATTSLGLTKTRPPGGPNAAAETLCVKAVQQQTNAEGVGVISSEFSQAATQVMLGFPAAQTPWRCLVSGDRVTEVGPATS